MFAGAPTSRADAQWVPYEEADVLAKKGSIQPAHFHPVQFEVLGTILPKNFHMAAHGDWHPSQGNEYCHHRGSFLLAGIGMQTVEMTWPCVVNNLRTFAPDTSNRSLITAKDELVLSHRLFQVS